MSEQDRHNERVVRGLFEEVINRKRYGRIPQYCTAGVRMHRPGNEVIAGIDAYTDHYRQLHAALPDFDASLADVVVDGDRIATRFSVTGTHRKELLDVAPTGNEVRFPAQILFHFDNGAVAREYHLSDRTALREQLR
jgi:predicted ester cyclase